MLSLSFYAFLAVDAVKLVHVGSQDVSARDLTRHRMKVPGVHFQASTADDIHTLLNSALTSGPVRMPLHSPCETYNITALAHLQKEVFKRRAQVLLTNTDGRAPLHRTLDALEDEHAQNEVYVRSHPHVADAVRDGMCNAIALSWVHHLTDAGRTDLSSYRLPLLSLMTTQRWSKKLSQDPVLGKVFTVSTPCEEGHNLFYNSTIHDGIEGGSLSWPQEGEYQGVAYDVYPFWPIVVDGQEMNRTNLSRSESAHGLSTVWSARYNARRMTHSMCYLQELGLGWSEDSSCTLLMNGPTAYLYDSNESNCCLAGYNGASAAPGPPGSDWEDIIWCDLDPMSENLAEWWVQSSSTTNKSVRVMENYTQTSGHYSGPVQYSTALWGESWFYYVTDMKGNPLEYGEGPCEYPSTWDCDSGEARYGKHNGWNSRDYWPETFGERTVLESEFEVPSVCENVTTECLFQFPCAVSGKKSMIVPPLKKDMFVAPPVRPGPH